MKFKWRNVPIPEAYLAGIALGLFLQRFIGQVHFPDWGFLPVLGWGLIIFGTGVCIWAVNSVGETLISQPDALITSGPYAISRNPMYMGWLDIYCGLALVLKSPWMFILLPLVLIYNHFVDIRREEKLLAGKFGMEFEMYREKVRRYI